MLMRILSSLFFFLVAAWLVLSFIAGDAVEENGGIKATIIELGRDAKDVWSEIADYEPERDEESAVSSE